MLNEGEPLVQAKLALLEQAMPAKSAIVFGDVYIVDGGYSEKCLDLGCERVLLVDALETPALLELRKKRPTLDFNKGNFGNALFMKSIREQFDVSVVFDILLHQPPLLSTMNLILEKTAQRLVLAQPVLKEVALPNTLVYLPGNEATDAIYPLAAREDDYKAFDVEAVNPSHWIWAMTPSFVRAALRGEGFEITHEETFFDLPNPRWSWWGCIAERRRENPQHWSLQGTVPGLHQADW